MRVRVLLFGAEAMVVGRDAVEVDVECQALENGRGGGVEAGVVLEQLGVQHPRLAPHLRSARLAINHEFVGADREVCAGDEVALIGLVSGG